MSATPRLPGAATAAAQRVSAILFKRARVIPETGEVDEQGDHVFSQDELARLLGTVRLSSVTLRGTYAAVKAKVAGSRLLTLALCNLSQRRTILPSQWTMRVFNLLRKKGPSLIRNLDNTRFISITSELAAVHDGLFLRRIRAILEVAWGARSVRGNI